MKNNTFNRTFTLTTLSLLVLSQSNFTIAEETQLVDTELQTIEVRGKHNTTPKKADVTGLGTIKKSAEKLQRDQVENIRDLTRYDPDISVNEAGGRGTSRGFSMRGVEKERIAIDVDGFASPPILKRDDPTAGYHRVYSSSSSINEVEYENLKQVDLRKGSSSAETGNGALGGSVSMTTKDASDFFHNEENYFAGRLKTGFTSKDKRTMYSIALAARNEKLEGFFQYTKRRGHEIRAHKDLYKSGDTIRHYEYVAPNTADGFGDFKTSETYFAANDVSGPDRRVPNPLDYQSESFLSKAGLHITSEHYVGVVFDTSIQQYDLREMFLPNYWWKPSEDRKSYEPLFAAQGFTEVFKYTPSRFYIDRHKTERAGLEYKYTAENRDKLIDTALLRLDRRYLTLQSQALTLNCATWPTTSKSCFPSDKHYVRGQLGSKHFSELKEADTRIDASLTKSLALKNTEHQLQFKTGFTNSHYYVKNLWTAQDNIEKTVAANRQDKRNYFAYGPHSTGKMLGQNLFISLSDRIILNDQLEVSLSGRYDRQNFKANPTEQTRLTGLTFNKAHYNNTSWDAGIAYQPFEQWKLTYRASTGFRTPSTIELIGPGFNNERFDPEHDTQGALKSEKSFNQEIGISFNNPILKVSGSYFVTKYKDVIGRAVIYHDDRSLPGYKTNDLYFNLYNFTTHGFDVKASLDAYSLWDKLPEGLEFKAGVGVTKIKNQQPIPEQFGIASSYSFDAIQPLRVVYGVEYNDPEEKWGVSLLSVYSKAKNIDELLGLSRQNTLHNEGVRVANITTRSWITTDLTAYYNVNENITLRAGVYNLFNHRYVTWESARQTAFGREARQSTKNYTALAAPGRNFFVSGEVKF